MQLPLSASALVILGLGAVLVGATILVVVAARRRKPASGGTRIPPDMRRPQPPVVTSDPGERPVDDPAARPNIQAAAAAPPAPVVPVPAVQTPISVPVPEPVPAPVEQTPPPAAPPAPLAVPVAAAAMPRPVEVSSRVDPPDGGEQAPPDPVPPAEPVRHHQAGSGRTVAAAVAQAFAVRAAAGRAGVPRPVNPPPDDTAPAPHEVPAPQAEPDPAQRAVGDVDPAATTEPEGLGLTSTAPHGPDAEPPAVEATSPDPAPGGNGWAPGEAYGSNGDHRPDGNGQPPDAATDGGAAAPAVPAGLPPAGWPVPATPAQREPEPEPAVPAPRPDNDGAARQDPPPSDARDRLLAVLLDDPERAVGAAVELEACLGELDRLSDAVRTGRVALRGVLHRLAAAGLRPDQLARLARMPQAEVQELLDAAPAEQH